MVNVNRTIYRNPGIHALCAVVIHASESEDDSGCTGACRRERKVMAAFRTTLITSVGAFSVGVACAAAGLALNTKAVSSGSAFKSSKARMSDDGFPLAHVGRAPGDPDAPVGYSPLGIAKINGTRIGVYAFQNGAKLGDVAVRGQASPMSSTAPVT